MKKTLKIIFVVLFTILGFLHTNVQSNAYAQSYTPVMGQSQAAKAQAFQLLRNNYDFFPIKEGYNGLIAKFVGGVAVLDSIYRAIIVKGYCAARSQG